MKIEGAPSVVKHVWSVLSGLVKSKSNAVKGKAAHDAMKAKVVVLGLINNKKIFGTISHKMNSLFGHEESQKPYSSNNNMPLTVYDDFAPADEMPCEVREQCDQELEYPSHAILDSEKPCDEFPRNYVSVTEGPRMSTCSMEDEIDILAEDFISRFRKQMLLQKQNSFQRYREMLDRSV